MQAAAHVAEEEAAMNSDTRRVTAGAIDAQSRYYALAHRWAGRGGRLPASAGTGSQACGSS